MTNNRARAAVALVAAFGLAVAACGGDDDGESARAANTTDRAFAEAMIPHHRSAVAMATVAESKGGHAEIKTLAQDIVAAQNAEIAQLRNAVDRLETLGVKRETLGMPEHAMGMDGDASMLLDARPFDRKFIDMLIPHHQGAIRMAQLELKEGEDAELRKMARTIIAAQTREIDQMNMWRVDWYGRASPTGGVPAEGDTGMHHDM